MENKINVPNHQPDIFQLAMFDSQKLLDTSCYKLESKTLAFHRPLPNFTTFSLIPTNSHHGHGDMVNLPPKTLRSPALHCFLAENELWLRSTEKLAGKSPMYLTMVSLLI
jgi:hypothetical protein